jgi:hypothetical protein
MKLFQVINNELFVNAQHKDFSDVAWHFKEFGVPRQKLIGEIINFLSNPYRVERLKADQVHYLVPMLASLAYFYKKSRRIDEVDVNLMYNTFANYIKSPDRLAVLCDYAHQVRSSKCVSNLLTYCWATGTKKFYLTETVFQKVVAAYRGKNKQVAVRDVLVRAGYLNAQFAATYFKLPEGKAFMETIRDFTNGETSVSNIAL